MKYYDGNYFAWQSRKKGKNLVGLSNPFYAKMQQLKERAPTWDDFFEISEEERDAHWDELDSIWQPLRKQYACAVPDPRALKILGEFSPLIEIGAGNGYWSALLQKRGADVIPFDVKVTTKNCWSKVYRGGPEVLRHEAFKGWNLFLCYPDEMESMAIVCLENFTGEYVVHVGELAMSGTVGGVPQAPFGRSSSADFQVALQESFHCLLVAQLHITLPYAKDCISVWKRTKYVSGNFSSAGACGGCCPSGSSGVEAGAEKCGSDCCATEICSGKNKDIGKAALALGGTDTHDHSHAHAADVGHIKRDREVSYVENNCGNEEEVEERGTGSSRGRKRLRRQADRPNKKKAADLKGEGADEDVESEVKRLREEALDAQYEESEDKLWACIPKDEVLPVDRAAPCLQHLLDFQHILGGRRFFTYREAV